MAGTLRLVTYRNEILNGLVIMLQDDNKYAREVLTDEQLTRAHDPHQVYEFAVSRLCTGWYFQFGEQLQYEAPNDEGGEWVITRVGEVIEGEVVEGEVVEGGGTIAAIESGNAGGMAP